MPKTTKFSFSSPVAGFSLAVLLLASGGSPVAAQQGYHVIGLTYPTGFGACGDFSCFGDFMRENITGDEWSDESHISEHRQDSIVKRLIKVLEWAVATKPMGDGWAKYLTTGGDVDWTQVNIAGFSNGSSHASRMGTLYLSIGRVALFAGPNDGDGNTAGTWDPASYIQRVVGITDTRYFGLVHWLNKAKTDTDEVVFKVTNNWVEFGMERPENQNRFEFLPDQNQTPAYFDGSHMLISKHSTTDHVEAHNSVVKDYECVETWFDDGEEKCKTYANEVDPAAPRIGYEPAWRCVLGTGDISVSSSPIADAGPNQIVECEGGGASVDLDGSATRDEDCGVLTYTWTGSFGVVTGRKPTVFLPIGTHPVTLVVQDEWSNSDSKTVLITVQDTQPPTISCPADIVVEPTCSSGAVVTYATPVGAETCTEAITTRTAGLASGSIFPIGATTVTYTATDAANNTASCSFAVKVLTAAEVIQDLISRVQALQPPLSGQQAQGLRSKLNAALVAIDRDQKNVACNKLNDFISQVQTYMNNGKLTFAQGQPLINSAVHVRNTLGCTALGCT